MSSSPEITSVGTRDLVEPLGRLGGELLLGLPDLVGQSIVSSNARRCMVRTASRTAGRDDVRSAVRAVDPGHHVRLGGRVQVARLDGLPSGCQNAASSSVRSVISREPPGAASTSEATAPGRSNASSTATPAPKETADDVGPLDAEGVEGREHVGPRRPRTGRPLGGLAETPEVDADDVGSAVRVGQIESHIRRSAMPAWRSRARRGAGRVRSVRR